MIFWRIIGDKLYSTGEVEQLGFNENDASYIPDEYLENGEFVICRTAFGFGDWSIISAMPRLLKEKYPNCKVNIPTVEWFENTFGDLKYNWSSWSNPYQMAHAVFDNNPHVDGFVYPKDGDIFHDHYRIYNGEDTPLVKQILKFWQFSENEMIDNQPELYWSDKEREFGDRIIAEKVGDLPFGGLLVSDRCDETDIELLNGALRDNVYPYFYLTPEPLKGGHFSYVNPAMDLRHMDIRIQLYIRSRAKLNVGNQCGVLDTLPRYADVYSVQRQYPLGGNFVEGEIYLKKDNQ